MESSHYLRPSRFYRLGRLAYTTASGAKTRPRVLDFHLKSTIVSKEGAWDVQTEGEDWNEVSTERISIGQAAGFQS